MEYNSSMSIDEKIKLIEAGYQKRSEISKSSAVVSKSISFGCAPSKKETLTQDSKIEVDEKFNELYQKIISTPIEAIYDILNDFFAGDFTNYQKYINMLKIALYKDLVSISNLAYENNSITDEDIQAMSKELVDIYNAINDFEMEEELIISSQNKQNMLFFRTSLNRVVAFERIEKEIPSDVYPQLLELIMSIIDGKFKGLKVIHLSKLFELRLGQIRIIFTRLTENKFLILDCFLKKHTTSKEYRERMLRINDYFLKEREEYLSRCEDPAFIAEHQKYLDDIIALCDIKKRELQ